jgi:hypothetical protein
LHNGGLWFIEATGAVRTVGSTVGSTGSSDVKHSICIKNSVGETALKTKKEMQEDDIKMTVKKIGSEVRSGWECVLVLAVLNLLVVLPETK